MKKWEIQVIVFMIIITRSSERIFNLMRYAGKLKSAENSGKGTQMTSRPVYPELGINYFYCKKKHSIFIIYENSRYQSYFSKDWFLCADLYFISSRNKIIPCRKYFPCYFIDITIHCYKLSRNIWIIHSGLYCIA